MPCRPQLSIKSMELPPPGIPNRYGTPFAFNTEATTSATRSLCAVGTDEGFMLASEFFDSLIPSSSTRTACLNPLRPKDSSPYGKLTSRFLYRSFSMIAAIALVVASRSRHPRARHIHHRIYGVEH